MLFEEYLNRMRLLNECVIPVSEKFILCDDRIYEYCNGNLEQIYVSADTLPYAGFMDGSAELQYIQVTPTIGFASCDFSGGRVAIFWYEERQKRIIITPTCPPEYGVIGDNRDTLTITDDNHNVLSIVNNDKTIVVSSNVIAAVSNDFLPATNPEETYDYVILCNAVGEQKIVYNKYQTTMCARACIRNIDKQKQRFLINKLTWVAENRNWIVMRMYFNTMVKNYVLFNKRDNTGLEINGYMIGDLCVTEDNVYYRALYTNLLNQTVHKWLKINERNEVEEVKFSICRDRERNGVDNKWRHCYRVKVNGTWENVWTWLSYDEELLSWCPTKNLESYNKYLNAQSVVMYIDGE